MKFLSVIIFSLLSAALIFNSCAKVPQDDNIAISKKSWSLWMENYIKQHPDQDIKAAGSEGLYVEVLTPAQDDAKKVEEGNWVRVNFDAVAMNGNVFGTRYEDVAKRQGTWTKYTDYVPQYMYVGSQAYFSGMTQGQYEALRMMKQGESLRAYIPSFLGYGSSSSSFSKGYEGQNALGAGSNYMIDMTIVEIIEDITKHEEGLVQKFARDIWNCTDADTVTTINIYAQRDIYPQYLPEPDMINKRDSIAKDSTTKLYYKGTLLNGFMFDTNIDSVAQRVWQDYTVRRPATYRPESGGMIEAFAKVIPTAVYNQWIRMVFTSTYGYGAQGNSDGNTIIQPYAPLIFEVYIAPNEDDDFKTEEPG